MKFVSRIKISRTKSVSKNQFPTQVILLTVDMSVILGQFLFMSPLIVDTNISITIVLVVAMLLGETIIFVKVVGERMKDFGKIEFHGVKKGVKIVQLASRVPNRIRDLNIIRDPHHFLDRFRNAFRKQ